MKIWSGFGVRIITKRTNRRPLGRSIDPVEKPSSLNLDRNRHQRLEVANSRLAVGMSRKEFERLAAPGTHPLPECDGFSRVIPRIRGEKKAEFIGL